MCSCNFETLGTAASSSIGGVTEGCHSSSLCASHEPKIWGEGERSRREEERERRGKKEGELGNGNRNKGEKE